MGGLLGSGLAPRGQLTSHFTLSWTGSGHSRQGVWDPWAPNQATPIKPGPDAGKRAGLSTSGCRATGKASTLPCPSGAPTPLSGLPGEGGGPLLALARGLGALLQYVSYWCPPPTPGATCCPVWGLPSSPLGLGTLERHLRNSASPGDGPPRWFSQLTSTRAHLCLALCSAL